jgi:threonine dehydrogenase-like Zn-dependent dehydrogenase
MRGLCYFGPGDVRVEHVTDPVVIDGTDAIVAVEAAGLCGSDLHVYHGRETGLDQGTVLGHEFVGRVIAVGDSVARLAVGDRVLSPFSTSCGECFYCRSGLTARCERGQLFGWRAAGIGLHGGQAERVRVPLADATLVSIDSAVTAEEALLVGDNLSTGFFACDLAGIEPHSVCVAIGSGAVGLATIIAARHRGCRNIVAVDRVAYRRDAASRLGAIACGDDAEATSIVNQLSNGRGADAVLELVGLPDAGRLAYRLVRPGGSVAMVGCYTSSDFPFSPVEAYNKNLTIRTGRCPARHYVERVGQLVRSRAIDCRSLITHRWGLDDGPRAYEVFAGRRDGCIKAIVRMDAASAG